MANRNRDNPPGPRERFPAPPEPDSAIEEDEFLPDGDEELILDGPLSYSDDELLAQSEYNVRLAGQERYPVTAGRRRRAGVRDEEEISVDPEELGLHALKEATQDFRSHVEDDEPPEADWPPPHTDRPRRR